MKISLIQKLVSEDTGVSVKAMRELNSARVNLARQLVVWIARQHGKSYGEISRYTGFYTEPGAAYAAKKFAAKMQRDWDLKAQAERILRR